MIKTARLLLSVLVAASAGNANAWLFSSDEVDQYHKQARNDRYNDLVNAPDLCQILSPEACALLVKTPGFELVEPSMDGDDRKILSELLSVTPTQVQDANNQIIPDARLSLLRSSATTLGVQVGIAVEGARFNRLWADYASVYDRAIDFEALLIENKSGRNILPPVVNPMGDSRQISAGGRVFRFADVVYRISAEPKFVISAPTWRDYLKVDVVRPELPMAAMLPSTKEEADYWKTHLVRGYVQGIETARHRVKAKHRQLVSDYTGMVTYHLLLSYNMISEPIIEVTHSPVVASEDGMMMAVDDSIAVLSVKPTFNMSRRSWEVYPQLRRMEAIHREYMDAFGRVGQ